MICDSKTTGCCHPVDYAILPHSIVLHKKLVTTMVPNDLATSQVIEDDDSIQEDQLSKHTCIFYLTNLLVALPDSIKAHVALFLPSLIKEASW